MTDGLKGKTALITGGSSGIGQATAKRLAAAGARVVICGRSQESLLATVSAIESAGGKVHAVRTDLARPGAAREVVQQAVAFAGRLDILVNNAGVLHPQPILGGSRGLWEAMFNVNVLALLEGIQEAVLHMRESGHEGHIVNISSLASRMDNGGVYGASKAAVNMISESLRYELEPYKIRVVNILPGGYATNLAREFPPAALAAMLNSMKIDEHTTPEERAAYMGDPDDVARAVLFAVSQPIHVNVFEIVVRPPHNTPMPSY